MRHDHSLLPAACIILFASIALLPLLVHAGPPLRARATAPTHVLAAHDAATASSASGLHRPVGVTALNPQPLPPVEKPVEKRGASGLQRPVGETMLNPQPLPPGEKQSRAKAAAAGRNQGETAIIIVSGKPAHQRIDKKPPPAANKPRMSKQAIGQASH
jgi:hypothetical protein